MKRPQTSSSRTSSGRAPTDFESRLYEVCKKIPRGKVSTYGALAKVLGSSPRAAGQALRRNPFAPLVPCHRVVSADGSLGGFFGSKDPGSRLVEKKESMLRHEGVTIFRGKVCPCHMLSAEDLAEVVRLSTSASASNK